MLNENIDNFKTRFLECFSFLTIINLASNGAIQGDEDTWLQRLLDEAKSSDEETTEGKSGSEKEKEGSDEEEFNPFTCDFTRGMISRIFSDTFR